MSRNRDVGRKSLEAMLERHRARAPRPTLRVIPAGQRQLALPAPTPSVTMVTEELERLAGWWIGHYSTMWRTFRTTDPWAWKVDDDWRYAWFSSVKNRWEVSEPATKYFRPATPPAARPTGYVGHGYKRETVSEKIAKVPPADTGFPRVDDATLLADPTVKELLEMLTYVRAHGSDGEADFISTYITKRFDGRKSEGIHITKDKYGNRFVVVDPVDGDPRYEAKPEPIMFSCHTDTVHRNVKQKSQKVCFGDGRAWAEDNNCLGADDAAGIWLIIQMIEAKVPGTYIFHREEEIGGKGSRYVADKFKDKIRQFKAAIAFDRKEYSHVITHQGGTRTCSYEFAKSLADLLGGKYVPDPGGTFTDTKSYIALVGECTNVSCGYHNAHGPMEWLDVSFLVGLRDRLLGLDWSKLVYKRKPGEVETYQPMGYSRYGAYSGYGAYGGYSDDDWDALGLPRSDGGRLPDREPAQKPPPSGPTKAEFRKASKPVVDITKSAGWFARQVRRSAYDSIMDRHEGELKRLQGLIAYCMAYPETVANFMFDQGHTDADIARWFKQQPYPSKLDWDADDDADDDIGAGVSK